MSKLKLKGKAPEISTVTDDAIQAIRAAMDGRHFKLTTVDGIIVDVTVNDPDEPAAQKILNDVMRDFPKAFGI